MTIYTDVAYVVQSDDGKVVKVGVSGDPRRRVYQITQSMPFAVSLVTLITGGRAAERQMKALLAPWKLQGEWFEPRPELNEFLSGMRRENRLMEIAVVDDDYCANFIKPAVLEYLNGRQPTMTDAGDLVYRFLREGLPVIANRMDLLHKALKREVPPELLAGFLPVAQHKPTPSVRLLPEIIARETAA